VKRQAKEEHGKGKNAVEIKRGKRPASHRYDLLPLLPSGPDGVERELVVQDLPHFLS